MKKQCYVFRNNRVLAYDSNYTGEEPIWVNQNSWDDETFKKEYIRLFGFYGYYLGRKELENDVKKYLENNILSEDKLKQYPRIYEFISQTTGKLCRALNRGMDAERVKKVTGEDVLSFIKEDVYNVINNYQNLINYSDETSSSSSSLKNTEETNTISIQERLKRKVISTLGLEFDNLLDKMMDPKEKNIEPFSLEKAMENYKIPPMGLKIFKPLVEKQWKEYISALEGKYEETKEGYSYLTKPQLKNRIDVCKQLLDDIVKILHSGKQNRKPRKKKIKSAEKQVSKVKYMAASAEYSIKSVAPVMVPGSHRVFLFNVKTRVLSLLLANSSSGLEVKGTSIRNFSENDSYSIKLRKPNEILPEILKKNPQQIEKIINNLSTQKTKVNSRLNDQTIILRVFSS